MNPEVASPAKKLDANQLAVQRTDLALDRTVMAADRTLMAWVRTAISMIGFGFTLYKFLQFMREGDQPIRPLWEARNLSLTFIGLGVLALTIAVIQHRQYMTRIGGSGGFNLTMLVATLVSLIGILAFTNVLFQIGPF